MDASIWCCRSWCLRVLAFVAVGDKVAMFDQESMLQEYVT